MKYKRFKKRESHYWITFDEFKEYFMEVLFCLNNEKRHHIQTELQFKQSPAGSAIAMEVYVSSPTIVNILASQPDSVCNPKNYQYAPLRVFLVKQSNPESVEGNSVVKTSWNGPTRDSLMETRLEPGLYRVLYDVDCQDSEFGRNFVNLVHKERQCFL